MLQEHQPCDWAIESQEREQLSFKAIIDLSQMELFVSQNHIAESSQRFHL